jgi:hypothetical protein
VVSGRATQVYGCPIWIPFIRIIYQRFEAYCAEKGMTAAPKSRPHGITALSIFFLLGAVISFTASASLLVPNNFLEPMWRLNPRGHQGLSAIGIWAVALLAVVSVFCGLAAVGLWRRSAWGHKIAIALIGINLISDVANVLMGTEPRAIVGVPIAAVILAYLFSKKVRQYFEWPAQKADERHTRASSDF